MSLLVFDIGSFEFFCGFVNCIERKCIFIMNIVFVEFWDYILNVFLDMKFLKIKIFRFVISYIKFLMEIFEESNEGKMS